MRKRILATLIGIAAASGLATTDAAHAAPSIDQAARPASNTVTKPTVIDLGRLGRYRVTGTTLNGQPAVRADKVTTRATAAAPYLHLANADGLCRAWNDASAVGNIHYVQAANGWPAYGVADYDMLYERYSNTQLRTWHEWHEWAPSYPLLAIHYACLVGGSDEAMVMQSISSTSVYWRYS